MGCCQSFPNEDVSQLPSPDSDPAISLAPLLIADSAEVKEILSSIPVHCRQEIINLPARQFLKVYQRHLVEKYYFDQRKFLLALAHEYRALEGLVNMMPDHKGHFIFIDLCNIMSPCFLELHGSTGAVQTSQWALGIRHVTTPNLLGFGIWVLHIVLGFGDLGAFGFRRFGFWVDLGFGRPLVSS